MATAWRYRAAYLAGMIPWILGWEAYVAPTLHRVDPALTRIHTVPGWANPMTTFTREYSVSIVIGVTLYAALYVLAQYLVTGTPTIGRAERDDGYEYSPDEFD